MTPKQTTKHGKPCWTIDARTAGHGRLFGASKDEVLNKLRQKMTGVDHIEMTDQDRQAKRELGDRGTMLEAVRYFLSHKPTGKRVKLAYAVDECCTIKAKRNRRAAYVSHMRHILGQFLTYAGEVNCCDINARHIEGFLDSKVWAASTRAGMRNRLSAFFGYCMKQGYCSHNPVDAIELESVEKTRPHIFTVEQAHRLLDTAHVLFPTMLPYVAIGLFCGVRPDELKRLPASAVKIDQGIIDVPPHVTKTHDRRIVEISENARAWLRAGVFDATRETLFFSRRHHRALCELAHVEWLPDVMRHTFASYHVAQHQSADKTALELGHHGSTKMLFRHYKATVTKEEAATFWQLEPCTLLRIVPAVKTGTED